uniref:Salivary lipocalin n=1 Tax=Triatoma infestans TaxID=30076 RepID=A6YPQ0_TRIIF|nr:salivary lipocalin [Triatoma infestans]
MKTIIAVILFVVLTYASEEITQTKQKLVYGQNKCQGYGGMINLDPKRFFKGNWSLIYSTPSSRLSHSNMCRDYKITPYENRTVEVTYEYDENRCGNHYVAKCYGNQNSTREDQFDFDCYLHNEREELTSTHVNAYFLATDYDNFSVAYRCVQSKDHFEDNIFILFRPDKTDEDYANTIAEHYGLTMDDFLARKDAPC